MTIHRQLLLAIYLPSLLIAIAQGMVMLLIPLFALEQGSSWLEAGFIFTLKNIGTLLSSLPGGVAIARIGEKKVMLLGAILIAIACFSITQWYSIAGLGVGLFLFGMGVGLWTLARQSFLSGYCQSNQRGRVMSTVASLQRAGTFLGPLLGGILCQYSDFDSAFFFAAIIVSVSLICVTLTKVIKHNTGKVKSFRKVVSNLPYLIKQNKAVFFNSALFVAMLKLVRGARQLLLPLWGYHIGLSITEIGFAFALSAFIDVVFIYLGGSVADQYGRKWSGGLCLGVLSFALILLPMSTGYTLFCLVAVLAGIGNGLGGGIIMVLGADLAPKENRGMFLGAWRLMSDTSGALAPVLVGGIGSLVTLGTASIVSGGLGLLGVAVLLFRMNETLVSKNTDTKN